MKRWIPKATAQHFISWLPWSYRWNELLQKYVSKWLQLRPAGFEGKLDCCRTHWEHYQSFSSKAKATPIVLELGTGQFPIVPVALYLCGAESVATYDLGPLIRPATLRQTLAFFCEYDRNRQLSAKLPGVRPERVSHRCPGGRERRVAIFPGASPPFRNSWQGTPGAGCFDVHSDAVVSHKSEHSHFRRMRQVEGDRISMVEEMRLAEGILSKPEFERLGLHLEGKQQPQQGMCGEVAPHILRSAKPVHAFPLFRRNHHRPSLQDSLRQGKLLQPNMSLGAPRSNVPFTTCH